MNRLIRTLVFILFLTAIEMLPQDASAQYWGRRGRDYQAPERDIFPGNAFTFCRIAYQSQGRRDGGRYGGRGGRRGGWGSWRTDYPESDLNFPLRLSELTTIEINRTKDGRIKHVCVDLLDEDLYHYPFAYMLEVGGLFFSEDEAAQLRDYLLRGGFLMVDDFWGSGAWANWEYEFSKVFPPDEYPMIDIPLDHEIFHIVFDIEEVPQIPGIGYW